MTFDKGCSGRSYGVDVGDRIRLRSGQLVGNVLGVDGMFVVVHGWNPQYPDLNGVVQRWHVAQVAGVDVTPAMQRHYDDWMRGLRELAETDVHLGIEAHVPGQMRLFEAG